MIGGAPSPPRDGTHRGGSRGFGGLTAAQLVRRAAPPQPTPRPLRPRVAGPRQPQGSNPRQSQQAPSITIYELYDPAPEQALQSLWARAPELSDEARTLRESEVSHREYGKWEVAME